MTDAECVVFLQWALPRLGLRWQGFRKVRRQVCRRVSRRIAELGLSTDGYRVYLEDNAQEWDMLAGLCRVTISRFWRDRAVFEALRKEVLPELGPALSAWSAGCASGEEEDLCDLSDRNDDAKPAQEAGTDGDHVRSIKARRVPHLLDEANRALR